MPIDYIDSFTSFHMEEATQRRFKAISNFSEIYHLSSNDGITTSATKDGITSELNHVKLLFLLIDQSRKVITVELEICARAR